MNQKKKVYICAFTDTLMWMHVLQPIFHAASKTCDGLYKMWHSMWLRWRQINLCMKETPPPAMRLMAAGNRRKPGAEGFEWDQHTRARKIHTLPRLAAMYTRCRFCVEPLCEKYILLLSNKYCSCVMMRRPAVRSQETT